MEYIIYTVLLISKAVPPRSNRYTERKSIETLQDFIYMSLHIFLYSVLIYK